MKLVLLVELGLVGFGHPVECFDLFEKLLFTGFKLLLKKSNLILALVVETHQLVVKVLDLHLEVLLDFFFLLLFVGELPSEVDFNLCLSCLGLVLQISDSLFESLLLGVVELLELSELGLRVCIDLGDGSLLVTLFLFKKFVFLPDLIV